MLAAEASAILEFLIIIEIVEDFRSFVFVVKEEHSKEEEFSLEVVVVVVYFEVAYDFTVKAEHSSFTTSFSNSFRGLLRLASLLE